MNESEFDQFILASMPHFIAVNYQRLLDATTPQERVEQALHIYNLGLRTLTIGLVSQYLIRDKDRVSDPYLNELLLQKFPRLTLDAWQQIFFTTLRVYEGNRDVFFVSELYDFYWDTSTLPHTPRPDVEQPFTRLTQIFLETQKAQILPHEEAGWEQLSEETIELLHRYLQEMMFIGRYDLIRIMHADEQWYEVELHKGLTITSEKRTLPESIELYNGYFYLRKSPNEFLLLHPFLVFWEGETEDKNLVTTDTAVYDRFIYEKLQYLLSTLGKIVVDSKSVVEFITLLYDTIEEVKRKRREMEKLTWWQLCDLCEDISQTRMATVRGKYNPNLYLQREKTYQAFEKFLHTKEKKCFVLIGKSGVGKSNFILAIGEELHQSHRDYLCVLMYDGTHLSVKPSITAFIRQDFDDRLRLPGRRIEDIWREIAGIEGIEERLIILYVDAINEHPEAKELLRQLDELVQRPWPWLKVVISSRPETWQKIKRGMRLAERLYYREGGTEAIGVELEPFSYSAQMEPFSREELPEAYTRYQRIFKLQTEYQDLQGELCGMLRDPLNLWLVAKTYEGQAIPERLDASELIEQYMQALLRSERLRQEDLRLLEKRLIPLMLREGHYRNVITLRDIDEVGGGIYEVIFSEHPLSDGQPMNQSFLNLLDTDILTRQMEGRKQTISFKHERFYDYFIGKYLFEIYEKKADKAVFLEELVAQLRENLFLWGALRQVFVAFLESKEYTLIEQLGRTEDEFQADLLVNVLADYYPQHQMAIHPILLRWLEKTSQNTMSTYITANVAIACLIEDILEQILIHSDKQIRFLVVQEIHDLWEREPELTTRILQILSQNFKLLRFKKAREILDTLLHASILLVLRDYSKVSASTKTTEVVRSLWKPIIERLFLVSRNKLIERVRKRIRRWIIRFGIGMAISFIRNIEREGFTFSFKDLEDFFPASERRKEIIKCLTSHFDAAVGQAPEPVEVLTEYISAIAREGEDNFVIYYAALLGLIAHTKRDMLRTGEAFGALLENLEKLHPPTKDPTVPIGSIWHTIIGGTFTPLTNVDMEQEVAQRILPVVARSIRARELICFNRFRLGCGTTLRIESLGNAILGYAFNVPEAGCELVKEITRTEIERDDHKQLKSQASTIVVNMVRLKLPEAGMDALYDFIQTLLQTGYLEQFNEREQIEFWQTMADDLIKRAGMYRDYLVDLLERFEPGELPEAFIVRIRSISQKESITLNTGEAVMLAFCDALQDSNPFVRNSLKRVFHTATEVKNLTELVEKMIIYLFDLLYPGESLFGKSTNPYQ